MPRTKTFAEPVAVAAESELSPLELHALAKAARKLDHVRDRLNVGEAQPVDFTVRIRGVVSVAADSAATSRESPTAAHVLAALFSRVKPRARKVLAFEVANLFADFAAGGELPELDDDAVDAADDLLRAASREVSKPKRGNVSAAVEITLKGRRQKAEGKRQKPEGRRQKVAGPLAIFFCLLPSAFCLSQDWQPSTRDSANYPGPIMNLLAGRGRASCPPGQSCPPQYGPRVVPRSQQPQRYDAAGQQPQLPSTYSQPAAPDLSQYVKRAELAATLKNYVTRDEVTKLAGSTQTALDTHGSKLNELIADGEKVKDLVDKLKEAHNKNATTVQADLKTIVETTGAKLTELNDVVQTLAGTSAGQTAIAAGENWLDNKVGFSATAVLKSAFTFGGVPLAAAAAAAWLAARRIKSQIQNVSQIPTNAGAGGAAPADPFRDGDRAFQPNHGGLAGRARPTADTDGNAASTVRTDTDYRSHR